MNNKKNSEILYLKEQNNGLDYCADREEVKSKNLQSDVQKLKYDRIDLINRCKNEYDLKQKIQKLKELYERSGFEDDYEAIAYIHFRPKLKEILYSGVNND